MFVRHLYYRVKNNCKKKNPKNLKFEKKEKSITYQVLSWFSCDFQHFRRGKPEIGMGEVAIEEEE